MFSGSGAAKRTPSTKASLSLLSSVAGTGWPRSGTSRAASATARGTGLLNCKRSARNGKQGACAFSRSHLNSAVKRGRTCHSKRCSRRDTSAGRPAAARLAMPAPHTRRTRASATSGRWQRSSKALASAGVLPCWRNTASRAAPSTTATGNRSSRPSISHQTTRRTLARSTAPFRRTRKCWSSSMRDPGQGATEVTTGAPVLKRCSLGPCQAPDALPVGTNAGFNFSVHRAPAGSTS